MGHIHGEGHEGTKLQLRVYSIGLRISSFAFFLVPLHLGTDIFSGLTFSWKLIRDLGIH